LTDGFRQDDHPGVRLGGELVRVHAGLLHRGEELLVGWILAERVPGGAHHHALGGGAGVLDEGRAVEAVAAQDGPGPAALARLRNDGRRVVGQGGDHQHVGLGGGLGAHHLHALVGERLLHHVVAGLGEDVVVAVENSGGLELQLLLRLLEGAGDHLRLGERVAPDVVADVRDAGGRGVGDGQDRHLRLLRQRVGRAGGVRERGTDDGADLVPVDELLEHGDALFLGRRVVFDEDGQLHAAALVDVVEGRLDAGALLGAVGGGGAGEAEGGADDRAATAGGGRSLGALFLARNRGEQQGERKRPPARETHGVSWVSRAAALPQAPPIRKTGRPHEPRRETWRWSRGRTDWRSGPAVSGWKRSCRRGGCTGTEAGWPGALQ